MLHGTYTAFSWTAVIITPYHVGLSWAIFALTSSYVFLASFWCPFHDPGYREAHALRELRGPRVSHKDYKQDKIDDISNAQTLGLCLPIDQI